MYLQITTKCNMSCEHCCYSCGKRGKHGDLSTIIDAITFARDTFGDETITIGGGEPTLHPDFFKILKCCLEDFDYVWMATNGSQTNIMHRLADIIDGEDYPEEECDCAERLGEDFLEEYGECMCYEKIAYGADCIYQEDQLSVALSQDCFHDPIDSRIVELWTRRANQHKHSHFEIRNVTNSYKGVIAEGRAKRTGVGSAKGCVCSDLLIRPDGKIKLCGCNRSPIIGNIWSGIAEKWETVIYEDEHFNDERCYKALKR